MISANKPITILIVDDNQTTRESLAFMLRGENYRIKMADSGEAALNILRQEIPHVILLDVIMPDMDGYELCQQIKQHPDWQHLPVILITALASQEALVRGLELGADEFITKPVSSLELRARVGSMLRIKQNYDVLKENTRLREDLAHMMAHDMRNPLAVVQMNAYLMDKKCDNPDLHKHIDAIQLQTQALGQLVEETLLLARTENSTLSLNRSLVNMKLFVKELLEATEPIATLAKVTLKHSFPDTLPELMLDLNLLRRAADNLLTNAIKYSPVNGTIRLELYALPPDHEHQIALRILDEGPGVPSEERERIFDRFEIGRLRREGVKQTGLGLSFSKRIIDAHNGRLYVTENSPRGSIFVMEV